MLVICSNQFCRNRNGGAIMKKLFLLSLCLLFTFSFAQRKVPGETDPYSALPFSLQSYLKDWVNPHIIYAFNGCGDTLKVGHVVIWDITGVLIDSALVDGIDSFTVQDSLKTFKWYNLYAEVVGTAASCSLDIVGLDTLNNSQTETIIVTGLNGKTYSTLYWRKISDIDTRNATADTIKIYAEPVMTVTTTTSAASALIAGVVYKQSLDDSIVKIVINGFTKAYIKGSATAVLPGSYVETTTTAGYGRTNATPAAGKGLGTALESGNTDKLYWVYVCPAY